LYPSKAEDEGDVIPSLTDGNAALAQKLELYSTLIPQCLCFIVCAEAFIFSYTAFHVKSYPQHFQPLPTIPFKPTKSYQKSFKNHLYLYVSVIFSRRNQFVQAHTVSYT